MEGKVRISVAVQTHVAAYTDDDAYVDKVEVV